MNKLKNISANDVVLEDLGMQLLHPNEILILDGNRNVEAAASSQIMVLVSTQVLLVIDSGDTEVTDVSTAIDLLKGFTQKSIHTADNKIWVQSTPRPMGTFTCFTSEGDNQDSPIETGDGTKMMIDHKIGDLLDQIVYVDFNVKENKTFIAEGTAIWRGCNFDELHLHIVPKLTPYIAGTNTYFNLYGGFLIVPAAGDGTIQVNPAEIQLIEIPFSVDDPTHRQSSAFWDADYNTQTHQFENLRPNVYAQGQYNIFAAEINLNTVCDFLMLGDSQVSLRSSDVAEFGHGMRCKFVFTTGSIDHDWKCVVNLTVNRQNSAENG